MHIDDEFAILTANCHDDSNTCKPNFSFCCCTLKEGNAAAWIIVDTLPFHILFFEALAVKSDSAQCQYVVQNVQIGEYFH